jgi:hypothetical protein
LSAWYDADGTEEINSSTGNSGVEYPKGTGTAIFTAGLMWTGNWTDGRTPSLRTNGHSYNTGLQRGAILGMRTGLTEDPADDDVRIWRIRRNYATADLRSDAADINSITVETVSDGQVNEVRDQYEKDWMEWPAHKGAPFYDADSDGVYTPMIVDGAPVLYPDADEPGLADADQVIWYVANDIGVQQPWTNVTCGMEMQNTYWAYARTDELGNVIFKKYRIIYKGIASTIPDATIDNMYLSQWSDPDLGIFGDDYAGCDVDLSLGYVYNGVARDATYDDFGLIPPAIGYDFLQGPIVPAPGDSAIFNLEKIFDFRNLPMTAFVYFAAGGTYSDPPFNSGGGIQWNQMLRGLPPTPQGPPDPPPPIDPSTGQPAGPFWLYGDPVRRTGWIDGFIDPPGDRRIILASGPITMALGDTQELVSALVGGQGISNISSVSHLKFVDRSVQAAYDNFFQLPKAPAPPNVKATALDREIILDWSDPASAMETEEPVLLGFAFEGYNVYQFPSTASDLSNAVRVATFDVDNGITTILQDDFDPTSGVILSLPRQLGTDSGVDRFISITTDALRARSLINGQPYYFAVTAYNHGSDPVAPTQTLETPPVVLTVIPESGKPGTRYVSAVGDSIPVTDVVGENDAIVSAVVYNIGANTGEDVNRNSILDDGEDLNGNGALDDQYTYQVTFDTAGGSPFTWSLVNTLSGTTVYANITDLSGTLPYRVLEAGFSVFVAPVPTGLKEVLDQDGKAVFGTDSQGSSYAILSSNGIPAGVSGLNIATTNLEIRFDGTGSLAMRRPGPGSPPGAFRVPFSAWNTGPFGDTPVQVFATLTDVGATPSTWNLVPDGLLLDDVQHSVFEPLAVTTVPYPVDTATAAAYIMTHIPLLNLAGSNPTHLNSGVLNVYIEDLDGDGVPAPTGTVMKFNKFVDVQAGDAKQVAPAKVIIGDVNEAKDDVTLINVFPNPYYGLNIAETSRARRFVTFNHLPARATIRIFNLAGVLVRTLNHPDVADSRGQFMDWDLQNDSGLPVASGIYIAYLELRDVNGTDLGIKTLKLAVIQEQQFLRNF